LEKKGLPVRLIEWLRAAEKNCDLGKYPDNKKAAAKKSGKNICCI